MDTCWTFYAFAEVPASVWARWNALNRAGFDSPLLDADFIRTAWEHFGQGRERLAVAQHLGRDVAMVLLDFSHSTRPCAFIPSQLPLCPWVQVAGACFVALLDSLQQQLHSPRLLTSLSCLDPRLIPVPEADWLRRVAHITTGAIELPENFAAYLETRPHHAVANATRRIRKAAQSFGPVRLEVLRRPDDVTAAIQAYAALESQSWKAQQGTALTPGDAQCSFYTHALRQFCTAGRGRIYMLYFGEQLAAMELAVLQGSTIYMIKTTYARELRACSPGILLKWFLLQSLYGEMHPVRRLEYYGPLNESQLPWVTETRQLYHLNAYKHPLLASFHACLQRIRHPQAKSKSSEPEAPRGGRAGSIPATALP